MFGWFKKKKVPVGKEPTKPKWEVVRDKLLEEHRHNVEVETILKEERRRIRKELVSCLIPGGRPEYVRTEREREVIAHEKNRLENQTICDLQSLFKNVPPEFRNSSCSVDFFRKQFKEMTKDQDIVGFETARTMIIDWAKGALKKSEIEDRYKRSKDKISRFISEKDFYQSLDAISLWADDAISQLIVQGKQLDRMIADVTEKEEQTAVADQYMGKFKNKA